MRDPIKALILTPFSTQHNALEAARQEYQMAKAHYREVCARFDATSEEGVRQFRAASQRRQEAFERYMAELAGA